MGWNAWDNVKPVVGIPGGGSGDGSVPPAVLNHIESTALHLNADRLKKLNESIATKDIIWNMSSPLTVGVQDETEFKFPYVGNIVKMTTSISLSATPTSNMVLALQMYENGSWSTVNTVNMQLTDRSVEVDTDIAIDNNILRIALVNGDFANVGTMSIVLTVKINEQ